MLNFYTQFTSNINIKINGYLNKPSSNSYSMFQYEINYTLEKSVISKC